MVGNEETKKRECWKFLDWRLNSENDSRVHGQPSSAADLLVDQCVLEDESFISEFKVLETYRQSGELPPWVRLHEEAPER